MKKSVFANAFALISNLLLVYVLYTLSRLIFFWINHSMFEDMSIGYLFRLFGAGIIFDTSAILYTNAIFIVLFLFPFHWKENPAFYKVLRWLFAIINGIFVSANLIDSVYFQYTGRRTTISVFQEFSNEKGNIFSILLNETLVYWYLPLLVALFCFVLYKLFRLPSSYLVGNKLVYYAVHTVCLLIAIPLSVFGMRGGMTTATRPITISNANQYINHPVDAGIVLNTPFALFRTMGKKAFVVPSYMADEEMNRRYTALREPLPTVKFRQMNVVVFILESFSKQFSGLMNPNLENGRYKGYTPFLDSLMTRGLTFEYSYSNGRKSIDGMPSVLSSIPNFVEPFFLTPSSLNEVSSVAGELTRHKGYQSAFFHGAMNGSMGFEAFARAAGFGSYYGRTEYNKDPNYHGDDDFDGTWAVWDEEFLQFYCDKMSEMRQPFATSVFTASSHPPFAIPERYKGVFPKGKTPLFECIAYTDHAIELFFKKAEKQSWFKNTLFIITADHTSRGAYPAYLTDLGNYSVPIIFYAPGIPELRGIDRQKIVNQIDIMPTALGILGYDRPYVAFGQDALSTPVEKTFGVNYLPATGIYQFIKGDYLIQFDTKKVIHAYRYRTDPLLKTDVRGSMPKSLLKDMELQLKAVIQQYMERMTTNNLVYREAKK